MKEYIERKGKDVKSQIESDINTDTILSVALEAIKFNVSNPRPKNFQKYYFATIANIENYLDNKRFFHNFKTKYALQGIDNNYLDWLEVNKQTILGLLIENKLTELYFEYFAKAKLKRRDKTVNVDLGRSSLS